MPAAPCSRPELLTREIDWSCAVAPVAGRTPREDRRLVLIAEELEPCLDVPVEVVPMEELESVLENSSNGTVVTSRYFLQPVEELAKHSVPLAVDLNGFGQELAMLKELREAVWAWWHQPRHPAGCGGDSPLIRAMVC